MLGFMGVAVIICGVKGTKEHSNECFGRIGVVVVRIVSKACFARSGIHSTASQLASARA